MTTRCTAHAQLKSVYGASTVTCHRTPGPPIFMSKIRGPVVEARKIVKWESCVVVLKMINYGADPREVERRGQKIMTPLTQWHKWCGLWWQLLWQSLTASLGSNFEIFAIMWNLGIFTHFRQKFTFLQIFQNCCLVKPSNFVTVTVIIGHTIWALLVATPLSTPTLSDFLIIFF